MRYHLIQLCIGMLIIAGPGCRRQPEQVQSWQERAYRVEAELASALEALQKARTERDQFERLLNERIEQIKELSSRLDQAQLDLEQAQIQAGRLKQQADKTDNMTKQLSERIQALEAQLRDKVVQVNNLERTNKELQHTVQDLTNQLQMLVEALKEARASQREPVADANSQ